MKWVSFMVFKIFEQHIVQLQYLTKNFSLQFTNFLPNNVQHMYNKYHMNCINFRKNIQLVRLSHYKN
jgi:hypothetical protein